MTAHLGVTLADKLREIRCSCTETFKRTISGLLPMMLFHHEVAAHSVKSAGLPCVYGGCAGRILRRT